MIYKKQDKNKTNGTLIFFDEQLNAKRLCKVNVY